MDRKVDDIRLGDVCIKIGSGATPRGGKDTYKIDGIPLIRSQNVLDFSFSNAGLAFIDDNQARLLNSVTVQENDVLINITGDSVARVCIIPTDYVPARVNQHVAIVRANTDKADPYYLLYLLQFLKPQLLSIGSSGGTRNALTKQMLENLEINIPLLSEQIKIGRILRVLDDKITNNKKINHHLEQMAQAIFSEICSEGENVILSDILTVCYGKDHKWLDSGEIPCYGSGGIMRYVDKAIYSGETVLIPRKGSLNNVLYINEPFWTVDTMFYTRMIRPNVAKFVYFSVRNLDLAGMNVGSAVPSMTTAVLNALEIVLPSDENLASFEEDVSPMFLQMQANNMESSRLELLRDALLPRLMSGELSVSDISNN